MRIQFQYIGGTSRTVDVDEIQDNEELQLALRHQAIIMGIAALAPHHIVNIVVDRVTDAELVETI